LAEEKKKRIFKFFSKTKMKNEKNFLIPPTSKKFFRSLWEPVKGTFSKPGAFKQKGGKN